MRPGTPLAISILFTTLAFGQTAQPMKTLAFTHPVTSQQIQEVVNILRATGEIQRIAADDEHAAITLTGNAAQISLAEWLFQKLDQPPGSHLASPAEYEVTGDANPAVQVYYLTNISQPQQIQELVNSIRSITDIQRITAYNGLSAIVLRGTTTKVALAHWLIGQIDRPDSQAPSQNPASYAYQPEFIHDTGTAARVFFLSNIKQPQQLQEMINSIRSATEIQRITAFNRENAIILRGSDQQAALAQWVVNCLDKPAGAQPSAALQYQIPFVADYLGGSVNRDPVVEVYYLANISQPQGIQDLVNAIRTLAKVQRITAYNSIRAVVVRANNDQIAQATEVVQERDKPAAQ